MIVKIKRIFLIMFVSFLLLVTGFFALDKYNWYMAVKSVNSSIGTYQVGRQGAVITDCQTSCCSITGCRCCIASMNCQTIMTEAQCLMHSDVSGSQSGGMPGDILFQKSVIKEAGLSNGDEFIAAGMSPTMMQGGVLATKNGCSGCTARIDFVDKVKQWFNRVFIASNSN